MRQKAGGNRGGEQVKKQGFRDSQAACAVRETSNDVHDGNKKADGPDNDLDNKNNAMYSEFEL